MIYYGQTTKDGNLGMYNKTIDKLYLMQNLKSAIKSINILQISEKSLINPLSLSPIHIAFKEKFLFRDFGISTKKQSVKVNVIVM